MQNDKSQAAIVEATLAGNETLVAALSAGSLGYLCQTWVMTRGGKYHPKVGSRVGSWRRSPQCDISAVWVLGKESLLRAHCHDCAYRIVSTVADKVIVFMPTGESIDRALITSIASIRRAMRRIHTKWKETTACVTS